MRRIAVINQKGGVGKTTTCANLGAALAQLGRRVLVVDMDPQANLSLHLGQELFSEDPSTYTVLTGETPLEAAIRPTSTPGLSVVPAHIDLSGAELELASAIGRETLLRDAIDDWERAARERSDAPPVEYLILDCPPSLGLLSVNALAAAREVLIAVQTEFFALQGMSKLVEVVQLLRRRLNPELRIRGILPCLYDSRLRLAREVLAEVRRYFPGQVFQTSIRSNVKLAEAPSHGVTIFEYDPQCTGAVDHLALARELLAQEGHGEEETGASAPPPAGEFERRMTDLARGARPREARAETPGTPPEVPREPRAVEEPPREEPAQVRPATFPAVQPEAPSAEEEPRPGALALEAIVRGSEPEGAPGSETEDLIVLSQPAPEDAPPLHPLSDAFAAPEASAGATAPAEPPKAFSSPEDTPLAPSTVPTHEPAPEPADEVVLVEKSSPVGDAEQPQLEEREPADGPAEEADPEGAPQLEEVDVPRSPTPPQPPRWNFASGYGEDRPRMASKAGPRTP